MPEGIQTRPKHIRTNPSQISENKLDTCAPQPQIQPWQDSAMRSDILSDVRYWHVLSYSIWRMNILTCFLAFLSDILSFRRIIWHLIWRSYILSDIYSDVLSGNRHIFRRCIWHCTWQTRFFIKGSWEAIFRVTDDFYLMKGGVRLWCETLHHITIHSMKGGVRLWCETLHHITIHSMKGGVRRWCEIWHHITIHSMKGGVRLWCDTWHHITIHSMKGGVRLWCETWHHITIHSMKGGVRLWRDTWHHITLRACSGCMIVVMLCCYVRRYVQVCDGILRNALWWLHECCMGFVLGRNEPGARNLVFFRVKWLRPAMKGTSCVRRVRVRSLCFATSGCFCVRNPFLLLLNPAQILKLVIFKFGKFEIGQFDF